MNSVHAMASGIGFLLALSSVLLGCRAGGGSADVGRTDGSGGVHNDAATGLLTDVPAAGGSDATVDSPDLSGTGKADSAPSTDALRVVDALGDLPDLTGGSDAPPASDAGVRADAGADSSVSTPDASGHGTFPGPKQSVVDQAKVQYQMRFGRALPGGAYTNSGNTEGASLVLALASLSGNQGADAALLTQIRTVLAGANCICANGGYPAQHELFATSMFVIARQTPRIWSQISSGEQEKINALMEAALIASAFTTSDHNPYVVAGTQQYTLDGDSNLDRGWNPNYREGMVGGVVVAAAYFGTIQVVRLLQNYQHTTFVARLQADGLTNTSQIFNWHVDHPTAAGPDGPAIESAVHAYSYFGITADNPMVLAAKETANTYGKKVACGCNGGQGVLYSGQTWGVIDTGCATHPNLGKSGMLLEFDSSDAEGVRSSAGYAYSGHKSNLATHLALLVSGLWQPDADANTILGLYAVGVPDLWYKLDQGYRSYSHAKPEQIDHSTDTAYGFVYLRSLWEDVVKPVDQL